MVISAGNTRIGKEEFRGVKSSAKPTLSESHLASIYVCVGRQSYYNKAWMLSLAEGRK